MITNDQKDGPLQVTSAPGIPARLEFYVNASGNEFDVFSLAQTIDAQQDQDHPQFWTVKVKYSSKFDPVGSAASNISHSPQQQTEDPAARPPIIEWDAVQHQKVLFADIDGNPIVNSAGQPFADAAQRDDTRLVLRITKNVVNFDPKIAAQYRDTVNSNPWMGFPAEQWKCAKLTAKSQYESGIYFYQAVGEFHHSPDGWDLKPIDKGGYYLKKQADGTYKRFNGDTDGVGGYSPIVLLDGQGGKLSAGGRPQVLDGGTNAAGARVPGPFRIYQRTDFNKIGLP